MRHFNSENFKGGNFRNCPVTSTCRILTPKHRAAKITDEHAAPQGCGFLSLPNFFMWLLLHVYEDKGSKNTAQDLPGVCSENIFKLKDLLPIQQA